MSGTAGMKWAGWQTHGKVRGRRYYPAEGQARLPCGCRPNVHGWYVACTLGLPTEGEVQGSEEARTPPQTASEVDA